LEKKILVDAENHDRRNCPVMVSIPEEIEKATLLDPDGNEVPCQVESAENGSTVAFILDALDGGESRTYVLKDEESESEEIVELAEKENSIDVNIKGEPFTTYVYDGEDFIRPYLFPVRAPCGSKVTRAYPMIEGVPGETSDHPHHKSIWIAHGEVNGVDNWSQGEGHGFTRHRDFLAKLSGPVYAKISTLNDWEDADGNKVMEEESSFVFYNVQDAGYVFDVTVKFRATEGAVVFGDTKEGGIISVRVASSMDVKQEGTIVNSYGGVNEGETWGKKSHWCDYYGPAEGKTAGIAVFDHLDNLRHPTNWHVRNYGLMTANCFGLSYFYGDESVVGDHTLADGDSLIFKYRLFIHDGSTEEADVGERYHDFVNPPKVEIQ